MESRYIDVNEAYEHHDLACWYQSSVDDTPPIWTDEHLEELLNDFYVVPKDTSFADVVEITRCKDCFYAEETEGIIGGTCLYCTHWCKDVDGDTFCSNGFSTISKRRTEDDS